jgi:hypothetical protein
LLGKGRHGSEFPCDSIGRGARIERSSHYLARLPASRAFLDFTSERYVRYWPKADMS